MLLWDIIRDFFVQNIFGGTDSNFEWFNGLIGNFWAGSLSQNDLNETIYTGESPLVKVFDGEVGDFWSGTAVGVRYVGYLSLGDWLSTTATIIVLIALCFFLYLVLRYIFKLFGGLFSH